MKVHKNNLHWQLGLAQCASHRGRRGRIQCVGNRGEPSKNVAVSGTIIKIVYFSRLKDDWDILENCIPSASLMYLYCVQNAALMRL